MIQCELRLITSYIQEFNEIVANFRRLLPSFSYLQAMEIA